MKHANHEHSLRTRSRYYGFDGAICISRSRRIMKKAVLGALTALVCSLGVFSQQTSPTPPQDDDSVVKISTNLIRIDATVTGKDGKPVPGLTADDFEIFENGERRTLEGVTYVNKTIGGATVNGSRGQANAAGETETPLAPAAVGRTIAVVVDDLNLSFTSVYYTRLALKKFVDTQVTPTDLVAIIRTGGGVGALQQFTSDKRLMYAAIDRIRWNPLGAAGLDSLASIGQSNKELGDRFKTESDEVTAGSGGGDSKSAQLKNPVYVRRESPTDKNATDFSSPAKDETEIAIYAQASIGTMRYIIGGMSDLPGRKMLMLFSDGIGIADNSRTRGATIFQMLRDLVDLANRSSVVVYTYDTRGLQSMEITASDSTYEVIDGHREQKVQARLDKFKASQEGLFILANETGGKALLDSNGIIDGIQRALDEQAGYYLLSYVPDNDTFDAEKSKFNKIEVKVRQPGLHVNYRSGFFNTLKTDVGPGLSAADRSIAKALTSPFTKSEIPINVTALYADDPQDGPYIRSFLHIDARTLDFKDEADGNKTATFDVAAVTFGDNGMPVENIEAKYTIHTKGATYDTILKNGFVYVLIMPLKNPGIYQYRVALRDASSGRIGSASQIIEVPDLSKQNVAISGVAVEGVTPSIWQSITQGKVGNGPGQMHIASTLLYDTVLRQFVAGNILRYGYEVYNAKLEHGTTPKLETQARILQNNKVVVEGSIAKFDPTGQPDVKHLKISGAILLREPLPPGDYVLQLTVNDTLAKKQATQLFPFEIIK